MCMYLNVAKLLKNGLITVPADIRKLLGVQTGDKILFFMRADGEIVMRNAYDVVRDCDGTDSGRCSFSEYRS